MEFTKNEMNQTLFLSKTRPKEEEVELMDPVPPALQGFAVYKKIKRVKDGWYGWEILGKEAEPGFLYLAKGMNEFEKDAKKIPKRFKKIPFNHKWALRYYCTDAIPDPKLYGLLPEQWIERYKHKQIRIFDIMKMKKGEELQVLLIDRNLGDIIESVNKGNKLYKPRKFFRQNIATYTHKKGLQGKLRFQSIDVVHKNFEFDVEYRQNNWYPFVDGYLPEKDCQELYTLLDKKTHWTEFPTDTRIGWRGPMMRWSDVEKSRKQIYWHNKYSVE